MTSAKTADFTTTLAAGVHTFGEAYPAGTWPEEKAGETKEDKDAWAFADGVWTNSATGETWGDDKTGKVDPGA